MRCIQLVIVAVLFSSVATLGNAATRSPKQEEAAADVAVNLCSACHGPHGVSTSPEFPILAGQGLAYLIGQLKAFRDRSRADKEAHQYMWGIAAQLDDAAIEGIARYYSTQTPPAAGAVDQTLEAKGSQLFRRGVPQRGIPACATCHGENAEGDAEKPRLAGQHAKYVDKQLRYMQTEERNPLAMRGILKDMSSTEREAVAAYVQSLGPASAPRVGSAQ